MSVPNLRTLVLNSDGMPLSVVRWQRAFCLIFNDHVYQLDFYQDVKVHDGKVIAYPVPAVIAIKKHIKRDYNAVPFNRKNVLSRDDYRCQYCGEQNEPHHLTFDHVYPISRWKKDGRAGSPTNWTNVVSSCYRCNQKKKDRTCEEAGMYLMRQPFRPKYGEVFLGLSPSNDWVPPEWRPYLSHLPNFRGG
jgi:5-methylcytosine-specific restriction endonuclease McrA